MYISQNDNPGLKHSERKNSESCEGGLRWLNTVLRAVTCVTAREGGLKKTRGDIALSSLDENKRRINSFLHRPPGKTWCIFYNTVLKLGE